MSAVSDLVHAIRGMQAMMDAGKISVDAPESSMPAAVALLDKIDICLASMPDDMESLQEESQRLKAFANRFLDPEDLGFSVSAYIRDDARVALGIPTCETIPRHRA